MKHTTLVVMAAGIGSRFGGGIKQLEPMGPNGEIIMDYSIHDAMEAGFDKVVFIIRKDLEKDFKEIIGNRIEKVIPVEYAFQELDDIPAEFTVPEGRKKPWGTGQAILSCRGIVKEPFLVINADDYYGKEAFVTIHDWMVNKMDENAPVYDMCMAGYILSNTLSDNGTVTRGVCEVGEDGTMTKVTETYNIRREADGKVYSGKETAVEVDENCYASMNMWALPARFMDRLKEKFGVFYKENAGSLTAEFLLPAAIDEMVRSGEADCAVLPSHDRWFGVTYAEDKAGVRAEIAKLIESGAYPADLWGRE